MPDMVVKPPAKPEPQNAFFCSVAKRGWKETIPRKSAPETFTIISEIDIASADPTESSSPLPIAYLNNEPMPPPRNTRKYSEEKSLFIVQV